MTIFFSVGEPSGDLHGSNLIRALQSQGADWKFVGYGGPRMAAEGCALHADLTQLAVMWFVQALWRLPRFWRLLCDADRYFREQRPDAVVLIDFPGFNWWIARRAHAAGIPVFYYGTPQLWAWASYRVAKVRRFVDHALCKLPFEEAWLRDRGCRATYVGHPYFDELRSRPIDQEFVQRLRAEAGPLITLLPGSRDQELAANGDTLLKAAELIVVERSDVRFAVAAYKPAQAEAMQRLAASRGVAVDTYAGRTAELIEAADCCLACSGSVSLELLYHAKPSVIVYRVSHWIFFIQRFLRRVRYITLVNLLTAPNPFSRRPAGVYDPHDPRDAHVLMPEYLSSSDRSHALASHILDWLNDRAAYRARVEQLQALRDRIGQGGASQRAAEYLISTLTCVSDVDLASSSQPAHRAA